MNEAIKTENLYKYYKDVCAVNNISFSVRRKSMFALLGENGAGKSTTINIISTLLNKTAGAVKICGKSTDGDDWRIRSNIGIVFQNGVLDDYMTVRENLFNRAMLYGMKTEEVKANIKRLASLFELDLFLDRRYKNLSGGEKRRADIARALMHNPKIIILDEPTTGLDTYARKKFWETLKKLKDEDDITIFYTTHYMQEAELADYIVVIDKGGIVKEGTPEELKDGHAKDKLLITAKDRNKVINYMSDNSLRYIVEGGKVTVSLDKTTEALAILNDVLYYVDSFEVKKGSMDDVYLNLVGKSETEVIYENC